MSGAKIPQIPCLFVSFAPERVELHGFTTRQSWRWIPTSSGSSAWYSAQGRGV